MNSLYSISHLFEKAGATKITFILNSEIQEIYSNTNYSIINDLHKTIIGDAKILFSSNIYIIENLIGTEEKKLTICQNKNLRIYNIQLKYGIRIFGTLKSHFIDYFVFNLKYNNLNILNFMIKDFLNLKNQNIEKLRVANIKSKNLKYVRQTFFDKKEEFALHKNKIILIGQFNKEFIIAFNGSNIFILDQHAIHERIRLEAFLTLEKDKIQDEKFMEETKLRSCRGAIKFGTELTFSKMKMLIIELSKCKFPEICAHGRPSILMIVKKFPCKFTY